MQEKIRLKDYILNHNGFYFCKTDLFQFDKPDETIIVTKSSTKCSQSIEDFIVQSLLVSCCEDDYMKEENISIGDERMIELDTFLFSKGVGGHEEFYLKPLEKDKGIVLLKEWIDTNNLSKLDISLNNIEYFLIINEFDSMNQEMIFEDEKFRYFLSRGLG